MALNIIVVIEDKADEQENALVAIRKAFNAEGGEEVGFECIKGCSQVGLVKGKVLVLFSCDLDDAIRRLNFIHNGRLTTMTGVITDLMFPAGKGKKEQPNGLCVLTDCIENSLPVVVCSDTDHHDVGYLKSVFSVLGKAHPKGEIPVILDKKDWDRAVSELLRIFAEESPDDRKSSPSGIEKD